MSRWYLQFGGDLLNHLDTGDRATPASANDAYATGVTATKWHLSNQSFGGHYTTSWPTTGWGYRTDILTIGADLTGVSAQVGRFSSDGVTLRSSASLGSITGTGLATSSGVTATLTGVDATDQFAFGILATNSNMMTSAYLQHGSISDGALDDYVDTPLVPARGGVAYAFASTVEGWVAGTASSVSWNSTESIGNGFNSGSYGTGALAINWSANSGTFDARRSLTWADLGVPAGCQVTHAVLLELAITEDGFSFSATSQTQSVTLHDGSGNLLATLWSHSGQVYNPDWVVMPETNTANEGNLARVALSTPQASSGSLQLRVSITISGAGNNAHNLLVAALAVGVDYAVSGSAFTGTSAHSGSGTLGGTGRPNLARTVALTGSGTAAAATKPALAQTGATSGSGTLTATGVASGSNFTGTAAPSGSGTLTTAGTPGTSGTIAPNGSGTLTTAATPTPVSTAATSGSGTLAATGTLLVSGGAATSAWTVAGTAAGTNFPAPTGLTATPVATDQIDVSWNAVTGATGYDVERDSVVVATAHLGTTYSDTGLTANTQYSYRVRARK